MPKNAIKFIRDVEKEAMFRIQQAEKNIEKVVSETEEQVKRRRETEIFKLKKELDEIESREVEAAHKEAERIKRETEEELGRRREMYARNKDKAVEVVVSRMFKGD